MSLIANEDPNLAESRFDRISNAPPTNYAVQLLGINRKFLSFFSFFFFTTIRLYDELIRTTKTSRIRLTN